MIFQKFSVYVFLGTLEFYILATLLDSASTISFYFLVSFFKYNRHSLAYRTHLKMFFRDCLLGVGSGVSFGDFWQSGVHCGKFRKIQKSDVLVVRKKLPCCQHHCSMVCAVIIRSRIVFSLYAFPWKHTISTSVDDISFFKSFTPYFRDSDFYICITIKSS